MAKDTPYFAPERFATDDFVIRAYRVGDGAALQRAVVASYEHLRPWMPWARPDQTIAESEAICRRGIAKYLTNEDFMLGIWRGEELIGGTGFHLRFGPLEERIAEVGMWIHADCAGQGMGTRALAAMLTWGFTEWPWERLVWKCDSRNIGSARVAEKCGMVREGLFRSDARDVEGNRRDTLQFVLLRHEWHDAHPAASRG